MVIVPTLKYIAYILIFEVGIFIEKNIPICFHNYNNWQKFNVTLIIWFVGSYIISYFILI